MKNAPQQDKSAIKELVRAGHEFAAAMGNDTPIIEIAKLVSRLATELDVQSAMVRQLMASVAITSPHAGRSVDDYFGGLVTKARASADKAMCKFPQPNYVLLKVAEEAGEVVQAGVHYAENRMTWRDVEGEIIQLLAMLIRLVTEGDQVNGITPPESCLSAPSPEAAAIARKFEHVKGAIVIKQPKRLYEWHGATVALKRETANGWAKLPAGTVGIIRTVKGSRRGMEFVSNSCQCCGVQVSISHMRPEHFELLELVKDNTGEDK
ncbi:hypothetical protein [Kosakonia sacchari]|uniref:hypothetical protein n=1 Tax=Kosakonia sacchari TaxID=1158459 RepID=UPI0020C796F6|nr:hypothetical protein [Kosakonia sacchari]